MVCQFAASHADIYLILLKKTVSFVLAKLRCFQYYVSENSLFFFSYLNCSFDALSHQKHVLVYARIS